MYIVMEYSYIWKKCVTILLGSWQNCNEEEEHFTRSRTREKKKLKLKNVLMLRSGHCLSPGQKDKMKVYIYIYSCQHCIFSIMTAIKACYFWCVIYRHVCIILSVYTMYDSDYKCTLAVYISRLWSKFPYTGKVHNIWMLYIHVSQGEPDYLILNDVFK